MRKVLFIFLIPFILAACSEQDTEHYEAHPNSAKTKVDQCDARLKAAILSREPEKIEALALDEECEIAFQAYKEYERTIEEANKDYEEIVAKQKKEKAKKEFDEGYKAELLKMQKLSLKELYIKKQECSADYKLRRQPICKAVKDTFAEKEVKEANLLIEEYPEDSLKAYSETQCKGLEYDELNCKVSKIAFKEQRKRQIAYYLDNREELKIDFNECFETRERLKEEKKRTEMNEYTKSYQCSTALDAARKLKVSNYKEPIG